MYSVYCQVLSAPEIYDYLVYKICPVSTLNMSSSVYCQVLSAPEIFDHLLGGNDEVDVDAGLCHQRQLLQPRPHVAEDSGGLVLQMFMNELSNHRFQNKRTDQCFGSAFFADPDPGQNLHADPEKKIFFYFFFMFQMILNNFQKNSGSKLPKLMINTKNICCLFPLM